MMKHPEYRDETRIIHMCLYLDRIVAMIPELTREVFTDGEALTERILYNLTILGEAANNVSREYAAAHPEVDFRDMAGLRHKLIHDYSNIDLSIIWNILQADIPKWQHSVRILRDSLPEDPMLPENVIDFA